MLPDQQSLAASPSVSIRSNLMRSSGVRFVTTKETAYILACVIFVGGCQRESQPTQDSTVIVDAVERRNPTDPYERVRQLEPVGAANDLEADDYDEMVGALLSAYHSYDAWTHLHLAMAKALQDDKCVLVQVGGPGCAPCIKLSHYLSEQADAISRDYVHVKLDTRMPSADKVWKHYGPRQSSIPWMVILSRTGEVLATSECDGFNIGYPSGEWSKNHFRQMLASTARRLSSEAIDSIVSGLEVD